MMFFSYLLLSVEIIRAAADNAGGFYFFLRLRLFSGERSFTMGR